MSAAAAGGTGTEGVDVRPLPSPPHWYREFENSTTARIPPPPPYGTVVAPFGVSFKVEETPPEGGDSFHLDSDTKLYQYGRGISLRSEFKRLFELLLEQIRTLLRQLAKSGEQSEQGNPTATIYSIAKTYKNLQHVLYLLRHWQGKEMVLARLKKQLESRQRLIARLETAMGIGDRLDDMNEIEGGENVKADLDAVSGTRRKSCPITVPTATPAVSSTARAELNTMLEPSSCSHDGAVVANVDGDGDWFTVGPSYPRMLDVVPGHWFQKEG